MYEHPFLMRVFWEQISLEYMTAHGSIDFAGNKVCLNGKAMAICKRLARNICYGVYLAEDVVTSLVHWMMVQRKVLAGILPEGNWKVDSFSKPPGGKCVMVGRSLVEEGKEKVSFEMFNPSDEDVLLQKNTHTALVHPMEVDENSDNWNHQKNKILCLGLGR